MLQQILNLIFPKICINCQTTGEYLCKRCKKKLIPHPEICPYCHKFSQDFKTCLDCKSELRPPLEWLIIPFSYTQLIKKLILKLKYYHKKNLGNFLAERLELAIICNQTIERQKQKRNIKITFIPSHRFRQYFIKGYNQAQILAQKLNKKSWIQIIDISNKSHHTHTQAWLNRTQRLTNLKNSFTINKNIHLQWDEIIFIIDDVTKTWATINE